MTERDIAVVGFAHAPHVRRTEGTTNGVEMLMPISPSSTKSSAQSADIGFWCSGSSDYLAGRAFSFISAIDSIGAVPPINESHVEMDAAWALYEAYIKLLTGEVDTALVYGFGKSSAGVLRRVLALQTDPYTVAPLWPDSVSIAGLQARLGLDAARTAEQMARWRWTRSRSRSAPTRRNRPRASTNCWPGRISPTVAPPRHRADHRRCLGDRTGRRREGLRTAREPGLDNRFRAPHRNTGAGRAGPDDVAVDRGVGQGGHTGSIEVAEIYGRSPIST